jgi:hypothetical protein
MDIILVFVLLVVGVGSFGLMAILWSHRRMVAAMARHQTL